MPFRKCLEFNAPSVFSSGTCSEGIEDADLLLLLNFWDFVLDKNIKEPAL